MVERIFYRDADALEPLFNEAYGTCEFSRAAAMQNVNEPFNPIQATFALKKEQQYIGFINIWLDTCWHEVEEYPFLQLTGRLNCIFITQEYRNTGALKSFTEAAVVSLVQDYLFPMEWYRCSPDPVFAEDEEVPVTCRGLALSFDAELYNEEQEALFEVFRESLGNEIAVLCEESPVFYFDKDNIFAEDNINYHFGEFNEYDEFL